MVAARSELACLPAACGRRRSQEGVDRGARPSRGQPALYSPVRPARGKLEALAAAEYACVLHFVEMGVGRLWMLGGVVRMGQGLLSRLCWDIVCGLYAALSSACGPSTVPVAGHVISLTSGLTVLPA
jgi:hypothetical protein